MKKLIILIFLFNIIAQNINSQTITDVDGNTYNTVTIGTQVWMKENLKTTKFNDGTAIPIVADNATWGTLTTPAYCWYSNNVAYKATYGALYNWHTVNLGKLCPAGWHVPNDTAWTKLTTYLGGVNVAGKFMKSSTGWNSEGNGTNESGFTALPGGTRDPQGAFYSIGNVGCWWSSTEDNPNNAWVRHLGYYNSVVGRFYTYENSGISVRCLKDIPTSLGTPNPVAGIVIYPNPVRDILIIDNVPHKSVISILYIGGKLFKTIIATNIHTEIPVSEISAGVYILNVNGSVSKFVKL